MRRTACILVTPLALALGLGCQTTGRGVHTVPVARDYRQLQKASLDEAADLVNSAHRMGAQQQAPYEFFSAVRYLAMAEEEREEGDRLGEWDYAALAADMANQAIEKGALRPDPGIPEMPGSAEEARVWFDRASAQLAGLDKAKAIEVAPVVYAHAVAALSRAEHELNETRQWPEAARALRSVEPDIDAIRLKDTDGDGVADMADAAPWQPEDLDGFEDEDGAPDLDNDEDGVLDADDDAPIEPEVANRWHDHDGVPDSYPKLENLYFASGSAALSDDAQGYLRGATTVLREWPELKLHLRGHADDIDSEVRNMDLSKQRAMAVQEYLLQNGAPAGQLVITFHGEAEPAEEGATTEARAANRRVELILE